MRDRDYDKLLVSLCEDGNSDIAMIVVKAFYLKNMVSIQFVNKCLASVLRPISIPFAILSITTFPFAFFSPDIFLAIVYHLEAFSIATAGVYVFAALQRDDRKWAPRTVSHTARAVIGSIVITTFIGGVLHLIPPAHAIALLFMQTALMVMVFSVLAVLTVWLLLIMLADVFFPVTKAW